MTIKKWLFTAANASIKILSMKTEIIDMSSGHFQTCGDYIKTQFVWVNSSRVH